MEERIGLPSRKPGTSDGGDMKALYRNLGTAIRALSSSKNRVDPSLSQYLTAPHFENYWPLICSHPKPK